jgi:hypothetical protein
VDVFTESLLARNYVVIHLTAEILNDDIPSVKFSLII